MYRTAERKRSLPFRTAGPVSGSIRESFELFATVPRPGSFAISFRVGRSTQIALPGIVPSLGEETIDEMLDCLELFNSGDEEKLKAKISDEDYYTNFVGLVKRLAPDGRDVNVVGFTTLRQGLMRKVALKSKTEAPIPRTVLKPTQSRQKVANDQETTEVRGFLKAADSSNKERGKIHVVDSNGTSHTIIVPVGMMQDIVKPLWESEVLIIGTRMKKNAISLDDIREVKEDR